ncbi:MAG: hypothetical protein K9H64_07860 [Bacteroidales bacterium]|nr:hypothetical protein [Bacteroidales bacterium]MCF8455644.1 hypothetical protein [Bacteroidales bacterium]
MKKSKTENFVIQTTKNRMKIKSLFFVIMVLLSVTQLQAQNTSEPVEGELTFKSSQHFYVKYPSTEDIQIGDTLFLQSAGKLVPALVVASKSSVSCVCDPIGDITAKVKDKIYFVPTLKKKNRVKETITGRETKNVITEVQPDTLAEAKPAEQKKKASHALISGKIAAASYSDFTNTEADNSQRMKYTLSLNADKFPSDKFSAETYITFRHKQGEWSEVKKDLNSALKIYSLSVQYKMTDHLNLSVGRKINPLISNMGAVDGLQFQSEMKKFKVGLLAGTRPDYQDYSFNKNLMQFGAYVAHEMKTENGYVRNSLAVAEQRNNGNIDRRFIYYQHQNQLLKKLYLFGSFEMDLYRKTDQGAENKLSLTGIYLLTTYKPFKKLSLTASYDARKQVIYYESYKSFVDQLIDRETRQGYRFRINYRPWKRVTLGANAGYRFQKNDPSASKNLYSFVNIRNFTALDVSTTLSATYIESSYFTGNFYGIRLSKDLFKGKVQAGVSYQNINYFYRSSEETLLQDMVELNFNWRIYKKLSFSANYEFLGQGKDQFNRFYVQLRQRF